MSKIGKFIIENLTTGMYSESKIIYREYIQNAADQIDKALASNLFPDEQLFIDISIDTQNRRIVIKDNATGISKAEFAKKLGDIADSDKELGVDKGFRGIGRLGGLAYCDTLTFTATAKGEAEKSIMSWNAKELLRYLADKNTTASAEFLIADTTSIWTEPCSEEEHYFIVELDGIRTENHELLDVNQVRKYISINAPVPYSSKFLYRTEVYEFMEKNNIPKNEYLIYVNDEDIYKSYGTYLYENSSGSPKKYDELFGIQIEKFELENGELLAWMWYGISRFEKAIPESVNDMQGIRLRQSNIQLGDNRTLAKFFKESRGNSYFVGEVHAVHKGLIPNARRDYFNENAIRLSLEADLEDCFSKLHKLYHDANKAKNAFKRNVSLRQKQAEYNTKQKTGFVDEEEKQSIERDLEKKTHEYEKAQRDWDNLNKRKTENEPISKVLRKIEEKYTPEIEQLPPPKPPTCKPALPNGKVNHISKGLSRLDKKSQKLVTRIYSVINSTLPETLSKELIEKIQEELSK